MYNIYHLSVIVPIYIYIKVVDELQYLRIWSIAIWNVERVRLHAGSTVHKGQDEV